MRVIPRALPLLLAAIASYVVPPALLAQGPKSGNILVANQEDASASLISLAADSGLFVPVGAGPHEAAISGNGKVGVVTVYGTRQPGNELAVIDMKNGALTNTIPLGQYTRPHGVVFVPGKDDLVVITSEATKNVLVVNVSSGSIESVIPTNADGSHMAAITADGKRVWTSNVTSGSVSEIDLEKRAFVRTIPVAPKVEGIAVTPDGKLVFAGSNTDGTVSIIDTKSGVVTDTLRGFTLPYRLAVSADGRTAIACDPEGNAIVAIDVATRKVAWRLDHLASPRGVNIAPDGKTAFVTLADITSVGLVDMLTHQLIRTIPVGQSPDGVGYGPKP